MSESKLAAKYDRLYAAVLAPNRESSEVDEPALRSLLRYYMQPKFIEAGGGIIMNPAAGEVEYLTREQKRRCAEIAMEEVHGRVHRCKLTKTGI